MAQNLKDLIEVGREEFIEKLEENLKYQRMRIKECYKDWKRIDSYDNFEQYFMDADNDNILDGEDEPLDTDMIIGMPKMIGDFFIKYAQTLKLRYQVINEKIEKYYVTKTENIEETNFGILRKGDNKIHEIQKLEDYLTEKPLPDNSGTLYI